MKTQVLMTTAFILSSQLAFGASDRGDIDRPIHKASYNEPASQGVSTDQQSSSILAASLRDEVVGISPQFGAIGISDLSGSYTTRMAEGISLSFNLVPVISADLKDYYLGVSTGVFYSHLGSNSSNFFGANANSADFSSGGANLALIPVDLKVGYNVSDRVRVSAHGGGNLTYRSVGSSADFGATTSGTDQEVWRIFPNAGADVEFTVAKDITLTARPDFTITPGNAIYMGTLGIVAPLSF